MGRKFSRFFIRGWNVVEAPEMTKALVVMAPHTSMIDFIHGKLYFSSCGYKPKFLMKAEMFKWPLSPILRALGAVPIDRSKKVGQIRQVVEAYEKNDNFILVMCPEGTRKKVKNWKRCGHRSVKGKDWKNFSGNPTQIRLLQMNSPLFPETICTGLSEQAMI
ncbi:MAG: 1-acyl-sn-glycerol-3-phosphate acyltransferase [Bacteroidales bacterium]|nr:1-acyl-sn-glycerol-3-phosphate acyltransferase [Bacteroidales bacterium]